MTDGGQTRVALVTGGGRGIGRAITLALARRGHAVAVNYRRDLDAALKTAADVSDLGGAAHVYQASVDNPKDCERMLVEVEASLGPVTILVNNAGVSSRGSTVAATSLNESADLMRTHAFGPLRLTQLVLPTMRAATRGDVVMISSSTTALYPPNGVVYSMAKAAMEAIAYTLAREEARHGIRSNVVAPGLVATELGDRLVRAVGGSESVLSDLDAGAPYGHVCRAEDVAGLVAFLTSDEGGYINGQRLCIDGGSPGFMVRPAKRLGR